jgi:hypothetical protein
MISKIQYEIEQEQLEDGSEESLLLESKTYGWITMVYSPDDGGHYFEDFNNRTSQIFATSFDAVKAMKNRAIVWEEL